MAPRDAVLTQGKIGRTLFDQTVPMIIGMLGMALFALVDTFFVGKLGIHELAALSFTFPIVMLINNIALGLGVGAAAVISHAVGYGDLEQTKRLTTDSLLLAFIFVIVGIFLGIISMDFFFKLLGASDAIIPLIRQYMLIWYWGSAFVIVPMVGNSAIRAIGDTKTPSIIMLISVVINLVLDPILIFGWGPIPQLSLAGAAWASVIARAFTFFIAIWVLWVREGLLCFKLSLERLWHSWEQILYIGLPAAATRLIMPVSVGIVVSFMARFGPEVVAAFGVATRIEFFALTVSISLSAVIGPFIGQNWGAGCLDRIKQGIAISYRFVFVFSAGLFLILAAFAEPIAAVFNHNTTVVHAAALYLKIVPVGYGMLSITFLGSAILNVLHRPVLATLISVFHLLFLYVPLAYLGAQAMGLFGAFIGIVISDIIGGYIAYRLVNRVLLELKL